MQIPVLLDRSRRGSLTDQLVEQLRDAIRHARLAAGTRLPSTRGLADQLGVSRNTVIRAYEILITEGRIEARPASGIFVCDQPIESSLRPAHADASRAPMPMPASVPRQQTSGRRHRLAIDFGPGRTQAAMFPLKTWRRLLQGSLSRGGALGLSQAGDASGLPALRAAVCTHLSTTRGIVADPGQVFITGGAQEGVSLLARLFLHHGTLAAIEDPCHQAAFYTFEATGSEIVSVPVDFEGLMPEELPQRPTALLHLTPSHQFPTGHTLSLARREAIVSWARRCGCYIVEDDRDGDFNYDGPPLPAIAALAPDCAIHIGTFSRTIGGGLRLGYMVVPEQLVGAISAAKALLSGGNSWLDQSALAEMMRSNSYSAHVLRLRTHYKESRDILLDALRRNFGEVDLTGERGGLHLMWYLPPGVPDTPVVESLAQRARVGIYSLASGGAHVERLSTLGQRGVMLGYGALTRKQIEQGIARLSDAIDDAVDDHKVGVDTLFAPSILPLAALPNPAGRALDSRFRRRPALAAPRRRAASSAKRTGGAGTRMISVTNLYRYPIKGLSAEPLSTIDLEANQPFPKDRIYALARPGAPIDPDNPKWAKKGLFVMLMLDEGLARAQTRLDPETQRLTVMQGNKQIASGRLSEADEREELEKSLWRLVPTLPAPPVIVRARGGHFMDKPDNVISLINLATVRKLEQLWGYAIDPLRFRANIYIDGAEPWSEFDWVGGTIRIGSLNFSVDRKNGRCGATNVDPATGRRDLDIPGSLRAAFGHKNLGVYLIAREAGQLAVGDCLDVPQSAHPPALSPIAAHANGASRKFMCGGCYFIYEETKGLPHLAIAPNTAFSEIPAGWRCPDCGTEKATFRPYLGRAPSTQP